LLQGVEQADVDSGLGMKVMNPGKALKMYPGQVPTVMPLEKTQQYRNEVCEMGCGRNALAVDSPGTGKLATIPCLIRLLQDSGQKFVFQVCIRGRSKFHIYILRK
jgi:hypothetical protein